LVYAQHGAGSDAGDVFHIRSTDNGVTFSAPLSRLVRFLPFLPLLVAFTFSVLAEPPAQFDARSGIGMNPCRRNGHTITTPDIPRRKLLLRISRGCSPE
jgi:hypothetical protein